MTHTRTRRPPQGRSPQGVLARAWDRWVWPAVEMTLTIGAYALFGLAILVGILFFFFGGF